MAYIVKSSLDINGIVPWNRQEMDKMIEDKKEYLSKKEEVKPEIKEEHKEKEEKGETLTTEISKKNKFNKRVGDK